MAVKLLCLCLLLVLVCPSQAEKQTCLTSASNREECFQSGPQCAWCTNPHVNIRCHTTRRLLRAGCRPGYVYNPLGRVQVVKNDSSEPAEALFLQPQEISLRLRPGITQSFPFTVTVPKDQPITELTMDTSPVPAEVNITFSSVVNGNPLVVQVNVEAARCPNDSSQMQNRTGPWSVHITPRGFSLSVKLEITLECQYDYTRNHEDDACRSGPNAPVCSSRGKCVEDYCECEKRLNPKERYSGMYCECSNFDCPFSNNRICGGHGRCECGHCICDENWAGEDCSCSLETAACMASNQMLCNNRGNCLCGICKCDPSYAGPTCEDCHSCGGWCGHYKECAECLAFGTGEKKHRCDQDCGYLVVSMVETKHNTTKELCGIRSRDDHCLFYYAFSRTPTVEHVIVVRAKECPHN